MNKPTLCFLISLLALVLIPAAGCGSKKVDTVKVTGKATLDGAPIPQGSIKFVSEDGQTPTGGGNIIDGVYTAFVPPGKKKVLVNGQKVVGQEPEYEGVADSPMRDKLEQVTPKVYNDKNATPLEADITAEQEGLDFDLSSTIKSK